MRLSHLVSRSDQACSIQVEDKFGPAVEGCYDGLDFTLYFEEAFLSILPICVFVAATLIQLYRLHQQSAKVRDGALRILKLVSELSKFDHII
jgi:ATP-binding cassette subfamily C (CFTR/MRP) protein 1